MARFAKGSRALAISDRSGAAFPYREMVKEWTGAWVHISEFEPKQPQLQPHPVGADPQGLMHARPARVEFPVQDLLPNNPFTTTAASKTLSVSYPSNQINDGTTYVRFQSVKNPVGGVAVSTLQLETTLNGNISDSVATITLTDATEFPTSGFIMIEKIDTTPDTTNYGKFLNEVIQYTGKAGNNLTGCTRGTSAPFKGVTPSSTTATTHSSGAKVFGSYLATAIGTTVQTGAQPATETQYNSITVPLVSNASSTETGGGFQCTIGPINDRA
jgi:hypothetical protein